MGSPKPYGGPFFCAKAARLKMGYVKEIFEGNCLKDTLTIADSVESGLSALIMPVKAA